MCACVRERERLRSHPLVSSPNVCHSWGWVHPKPRTLSGSPTWRAGQVLVTARHIGRKLDEKCTQDSIEGLRFSTQASPEAAEPTAAQCLPGMLVS